jgi:uncharacterized protein YjaZ
MEITVHDTLGLLRPLFTSRDHPRDLFARARPVLWGAEGPMARLASFASERDRGGFGVMSAVQMDGYEVLVGQQAWGLFNPTRRRELSDWEFALHATADTPGVSRAWLQRFAALLTGGPGVERVACFLLPSDPANGTYMAWNHGMSGFGGVPGAVFLRLWPSAGNLARLGPTLARLFAHTVRWAAMPRDGTATLADFLVLEGLAAAFVATVAPDAPTPWLVAFRKPDGWDSTLTEIAARCGVACYDDLVVNVYGSQQPVGGGRPPPALPLASDELAYSRAVILEALAVTDPRLIAAHLYGDELAAAQGHPAVGLPAYAGFEVGYRLVQEFLGRTGRDVCATLTLPTTALLANVTVGS